MTYLDHPNNNARWQAKEGLSTEGQVINFAEDYQNDFPQYRWAVCVTEGKDWISGDHLSQTGAAIRAAGAIAVWVSDGEHAQCVWRVPTEPQVVLTIKESPDGPQHVAVNMRCVPTHAAVVGSVILDAAALMLCAAGAEIEQAKGGGA